MELGGLVELDSVANERVLMRLDNVTTNMEVRRWSLAGEGMAPAWC